MSTRADLAAAMLATAQALAARSDCPTLPDTYVHSKGEPAYRCSYCGTGLEPDGTCCDWDGEFRVEQTFPSMVRLADLTSDANGVAILVALREAKVPHLLSWLPESEGDMSGYYVTAGRLPHRSKHLGHAAAMAWLVLP